jgi:phospholipid-binding lipoprotein MlaA
MNDVIQTRGGSRALRSVTRWAVVAAVALGAAACATPPTNPVDRAEFDQANDPIEPTNRAIFDANHFADRHVMKPVAQAYEDNVPEGVRGGIHNFLSNLREPVIGVNDLLQGNADRAWTTVQRFAVNTTAGGLGLFDVATGWDLPHHDADFGQTFGVWGIGEGPFIELPLFGPSNVRDTFGTALDIVADPLTFMGGTTVTVVNASRTSIHMVDERGRNIDALDDLERNSVDFYATLRSVYHQHRQAEIEEAGGPPAAPKGRIDVYFSGAEAPKDDSAPQPPKE